MENIAISKLDPETEFLASKQETGNEWELFKENVRPLKRGRDVRLLNDSLRSQTDNQLKKLLVQKRRELIEAIDKYEGDDPLDPWIQCIKWVQEAFPQGGDSSGLVVIYEQCVRTFWHSDRYKNDLRYLKVWLEYAEHCADAEVIYSFLDANDIGNSHAIYYIANALHMESKLKMKASDDIFNLGIRRNAQPVEKLKDAYKRFLARSMRRPKVAHYEDPKENHSSARSFGTVLTTGENRRQTTDIVKKRSRTDGAHRTPLSVYNDTNIDIMVRNQTNKSKEDLNSWSTLGARTERNKENNAIPGKWKSYKIPQRPVPRIGGTTGSASIEVFVDEECAEGHQRTEGGNSTFPLRQVDGRDIKKETELLRQNPLRNFPPNSIPR